MMVKGIYTVLRRRRSRIPVTALVSFAMILLVAESAVALEPAKADLYQNQTSIQSLFAQSRALQQEGRLKEALAIAHSILARKDTLEIRLHLGWLNHLLKDHERALYHYRTASLLSSRSEDARLGIMLCLVMLQQWETARVQGDLILADAPENVWAIRYMALTLYMLGEYDTAETYYRKARENQPEDMLLTLGLGLTLVKAGKNDQGRALCRSASVAFPDDERVIYCLSMQPQTWRFQPFLYAMGGFYTDPWDKSDFASVSLGLDVLTPKHVGFMLDFSYSWNYQRYTPDDAHQFMPGLGLYYHTKRDLYWLHYQAQIAKDASSDAGHVLAFHAMHRFDYGIDFGGDIALGVYNGFQTVQLAPKLRYEIIDEIAVSASGMMQVRAGRLGSLRTQNSSKRNKRLRGSGELGFEFTLPHTQLNLSAYYGYRWYTVENMGLLVWNSDEELNAGLRAKVILFPKSVVSGSLEFRHDYARYQFGLEHNFHILGFMAGLQASF